MDNLELLMIAIDNVTLLLASAFILLLLAVLPRWRPFTKGAAMPYCGWPRAYCWQRWAICCSLRG